MVVIDTQLELTINYCGMSLVIWPMIIQRSLDQFFIFGD